MKEKRHTGLKRLAWPVLFLLMCVPFAMAQGPAKVTGKVIDDLGEPMIGVSVQVKGTASGAITDIDGNYSVTVEPGATLVFSYVGYIPQEHVVKGGILNVTLKEDTETLEEVVVIGYGVQKKSSVTGAISQVKAADMENRTITTAAQALQGKTAGVQLITSSGGPGETPTIRVRGYSSNVASDPLYVVDGVRLSDISGIDPNDIESMEVLKDAASAAIYGAEAGNGVILITTKKGRPGQTKISYDFQFASQSIARVPKLMNAQEYIAYMTEAAPGGTSLIPVSSIEANWDGVTDTDWVDAIFENSKMQKHNLSFAGGSDRGSYYLSLTYLNNNGIIVGDNDKYNRMTATINADYKIKPWLKVGTTNQIEKYSVRRVTGQNAYGSTLSAVLMMDPLTAPTYSPDNLPANMQNLLNQGRDLMKAPNGDYYGVSAFFEGENYNPLIMMNNNITRNSGFNVTGSIFADLTPFDGFTFTSRFGYRLGGARSSGVNLPFYGNSTQSNLFTSVNGQSSTTIYYQWENFANYMKTFADAHTVSAMLGMSFQEQTYDYVSGSLAANGEHAITQNDPLFYFLNYAAASATKTVGGEKTRTAKMSYYGRVGYDYKGRYMVQASLRADAADLSLLPASNRWGYFPAVSAGWTVSEEQFFQPIRNYVTNLKIRASWGQNGSLAALSNYPYSVLMAASGLYPFTNANAFVNGYAPNSMGNDELKWETSEQLNIGFDARFLRDRLTFSMDWFNKKTKDLLVTGTTPSLVVGGTVSPINAGNVENKGFEFELGWRDNIKDFSYSVRANLATLKNKVTYLDPSLDRVVGTQFHTYPLSYFEEGYPVYYFRGYQFAGIDPATGDPTFKDLNGDNVINDDDRTYIGDAIPDFTYGITLTAAWKGLDLTVFGTGSAGNDIYNASFRPDQTKANHLKEIYFDDRWTVDNPHGTKPRAGANYMERYITSDAVVFDGSFFKIKQIQLGYTLPKTWLKKAFINNLRVYCSLDDFFTFTSYPGFDPEASANSTNGMGIDMGGYPSSKKVVFGFNIEF
ncbi:MAG TPA: TonB-dependent receptor [Candidatus Bacteroides merdigallinarum]|uniref:TonB-dependent receptor n=1 Tax=Candidatus Bacteroides merdigallinarum TaxID=2838473 RepID=A0A9D2E9R3_9BACE|nr:TonB-dependent receptor [Candidatus Bacteroides merdigallinarum]